MSAGPLQPFLSPSTLYTGTSRPRIVCSVVRSPRAPTTSDLHYQVGTLWLYTTTATFYGCAAVGSGSATWVLLGIANGAIATITPSSGSAIAADVSGNVNINGTSNQITATGDGVSTLAISLPSAIIAPGSVTATTTLTATLGAITATNGNLVLAHAGNKLVIHATTSASDSCGVTGNMTGTPGVIAVSTTACTASSVILYSRATTGGTPGEVSITAQSTSGFTLTSTGNETSTFNYLIIN